MVKLELLERWKKNDFSFRFNFWRPKERGPIRKREKEERIATSKHINKHVKVVKMRLLNGAKSVENYIFHLRYPQI